MLKTLARAEDQAEILGRLKTVRSDSRRRWGRMTAPQMICHLSDAYRVVVDDRTVRPIFVPIPRPLMRWAALYAPFPWPRGIPTWPEIDALREGTRPTRFTADVAALETMLERFTALAETLDGRRHETLGVMSSAEWLRWGYLHPDHHLRQFGA